MKMGEVLHVSFGCYGWRTKEDTKRKIDREGEN